MRIGIIGAGVLGSEVAYTLLLLAPHKITEQVIVYLYDKDMAKVDAQVMDLNDAMAVIGKFDRFVLFLEYFSSKYDLLVYTAGVRRTADQSRADLFTKNKEIALEVAKELRNYKGKILVATNPVYNISDVLREELPKATIIPCDARLDNARVSHIPGVRVEGIHGDYYMPQVVKEKRERARSYLKNEPKEIITGKGYTQFGPAAAIALQALEILKGD